MEGQEVTGMGCPLQLGMVPSADGTECVCNTAGGVIDNPKYVPPSPTTAGSPSSVPLCICPAGQTLDATNATCLESLITETCESSFANLVTAYNNSDWVKYIAALSSYQNLNCTDPCKLEIYKLIHDLSTGNMSSAQTRLSKYQTICPDCNMYFDL